MIRTVAVLAALAVYAAVTRRDRASPHRRVPRPSRRDQDATGTQALAGALVVGVVAGLSLQSALERARPVLGVGKASEVDSVLRDAQRMGLAAALARSQGSMAPLFERLARAQVSGAPLAATVAGFAAEERELRRAERIEAARKLPVRLTIPLALLVLPGFVVLTAGPAVVGSLQRMLGPLMP